MAEQSTGQRQPGAIVRTPGAFAHTEERHALATADDQPEKWVLLAGRLIFGGYFLYNGINHIRNRDALVEYAQSKGVRAAARSESG